MSIIEEQNRMKKKENNKNYESTYLTINTIYKEINKFDINAYLVGGISAAIQANIDLYRQNEDIDLMVDNKDLEKLLEVLKKIGYKVEDKRGKLTGNYLDKNGVFHPMDHELNANTNNSDMLGIGIFVYERKEGTVITNSYSFNEKEKCYIGRQKVMPEELFDLMYNRKLIDYKGIKVKCQTKEFTYLSKSKGNREKDKLDASVIEKHIGPSEQKRIDRIKFLQKRIQEYIINYDKDGKIISSEKIPNIENSIEEVMTEIISGNEDMTNEQLKELILNNKDAKRFIEQDEDIRNIMSIWNETKIEGDLVKAAVKIAHDYIYADEPYVISASILAKKSSETPIDLIDEAQETIKGLMKDKNELIEELENRNK